MTYLLDVNALLSLAHLEHEFHGRVGNWVKSLHPGNHALASCSLTEIGMVRILPQLPEADYTVGEAKELLARIKTASVTPFLFLDNPMGADRLPAWVRRHRQVTDGHLAALARNHGAVLATLDKKIPGSFPIPA